MEEIEEIWKYGWVWKYKIENRQKINYVNNKTINYCVKYVSKVDEMYKHYKAKTLASPGIGSNYTNTLAARQNKFNWEKTATWYRTNTGHKIALPKYWRNKIYTDDEREDLWIESLNNEIRWICGERVDMKHTTAEEMIEIRKYYHAKNKRLGYGSHKRDEERAEWEENRRGEKFAKRIEALKEWWE